MYIGFIMEGGSLQKWIYKLFLNGNFFLELIFFCIVLVWIKVNGKKVEENVVFVDVRIGIFFNEEIVYVCFWF